MGEISATILLKVCNDDALTKVFQGIISKGMEVNAENIYNESKDIHLLCQYMDIVNGIDKNEKK